MTTRRLVVPREAIQGDEARVTGALRHHLCHVLRIKPGARLTLVDGSGAAYEGTIARISTEEVVIALTSRVEPGPAPVPRLVLVYGLSRRARTEWVLQKATELGVDWIIPAICQRTVARPAQPERRQERWLEIIAQAARQCGRVSLPLLSLSLPLAAALVAPADADCRLLATRTGLPLSQLAQSVATASCVALVVGPEGGLTAEEEERATAAGYAPVSLGPLVMRTETAAVAALALTGYLGGRLEG